MTDRCPNSGKPFDYLLSTAMRETAGQPPVVKDIYQCQKCTLMRLAEPQAMDEKAYETDEYRRAVGQDPSPEAMYAEYLPAAVVFLRWFREFDDHQDHPMGVCMDVGAGVGALLDRIKDVAGVRIAVEPCAAYHPWLARRQDVLYSYADSALMDGWRGKVNHAFCVTTLEHISDPWAVLKDIRELMAPDGALYLGLPAPNPMKLFTDAAYRRIFFCAQHRWYFTAQAVKQMLLESGLALAATMTVDRGDGWWYHCVKAVRLRETPDAGSHSVP